MHHGKNIINNDLEKTAKGHSLQNRRLGFIRKRKEEMLSKVHLWEPKQKMEERETD